MLNQVKRLVIRQLWQNYMADLRQVSHIKTVLKQQYNEVLSLDHFAIIDLPGPHTGIVPLIRLFSFLDYEVRGQDYLPEKQNEFVWLAEKSSNLSAAAEALPQVVVADFRRDALAPEVQKIIDTYASQSKPLNIKRLAKLHKLVLAQNRVAALEFINLVMVYLKGRDWPLPSVKEFETVKRYNELLAWVLVMGRQINHFAWAIHLSKTFTNLKKFNKFVNEILFIPLNAKDGLIKAQLENSIEQSSTAPITKIVALTDGIINLPDRFIEFVWRYSLLPSCEKPHLWKDYFNGFVANNADRVVEALYLD